MPLSRLRASLRTRYAALAALVALLAGAISYQAARSRFESGTRVIYNLERKENDLELARLVDQADRFVYFAIYTFTKDDVADALVRARSRGLSVVGVMDRGQAETVYERPLVEKLRQGGVAVSLSTNPQGIMHAKILVTDKAYASGSYNWTASATVYNDEVLEIGADDYVRSLYLALVRKIFKHNGAA